MIDHLSPSGLGTWRDCNRKWWFAYISDLPKAPPSVDMLVGTITHAALEILFDPEVESPAKLATVASIAWEAHVDEFPEGTDLLAAKRRVWEALNLLHDWWWGDDVYATELEVRGTVETSERNEATFLGYADLVTRNALGALNVRDAKTGKPPTHGPWFADKLSEKLLQVRLYGVFIPPQEGLPVDAMYLDFSGTGRVETHWTRSTEGALEVFCEAWDDMEIASEDKEYAAPNPGPLCGWCDFVEHCPEGQRAVHERDALNKNIGPARERLGL